MILFWIILLCYLYFAFKDIKKAIIAWIPFHCLFNPAIVLWGFSPILPLADAISLLLPIIFYIKNVSIQDKESFIFKITFILYLISYILSILFSPYDILQYLLFNLKFFVNSFLIVYLFQKCLKTKAELDFLIRSSSITILIAVTLGISEFILGYNIWTDYFWSVTPLSQEEMIGRTFSLPSFLSSETKLRFGLPRIYSFFSLHLTFGFFCAIFILFFGMLWKNKYKFCNKFIIPGTLILCFIGVFLSNSKGPFVMVMILILSIFPIKSIFNIKLFFFLMISLIILLNYFPSYFDSIMSIWNSDLSEEGKGSSISLRLQQLDVAINLFSNNPIIGSGPESLRILSNTSEGEGILGAESIWLKILPERGIFGLIAYLSFYIVAFNYFRRKIPFKELFIILLAIGVAESTNGQRDMMLYICLLISLNKYYEIKRIDAKRHLVSFL